MYISSEIHYISPIHSKYSLSPSSVDCSYYSKSKSVVQIAYMYNGNALLGYSFL